MMSLAELTNLTFFTLGSTAQENGSNTDISNALSNPILLAGLICIVIIGFGFIVVLLYDRSIKKEVKDLIARAGSSATHDASHSDLMQRVSGLENNFSALAKRQEDLEANLDANVITEHVKRIFIEHKTQIESLKRELAEEGNRLRHQRSVISRQNANEIRNQILKDIKDDSHDNSPEELAGNAWHEVSSLDADGELFFSNLVDQIVLDWAGELLTNKRYSLCTCIFAKRARSFEHIEPFGQRFVSLLDKGEAYEIKSDWADVAKAGMLAIDSLLVELAKESSNAQTTTSKDDALLHCLSRAIQFQELQHDATVYYLRRLNLTPEKPVEPFCLAVGESIARLNWDSDRLELFNKTLSSHYRGDVADTVRVFALSIKNASQGFGLDESKSGILREWMMSTVLRSLNLYDEGDHQKLRNLCAEVVGLLAQTQDKADISPDSLFDSVFGGDES